MRTTLLRPVLAGVASAAVAVLATLAPGSPAVAADWTPTDPVSSSGTVPTRLEVVGTGPGDAVAVWVRPGAGGSDVEVASATDGTWGEPLALGTGALDSVRVSASSKGHVVVAWLEEDGDDLRVVAARRNPAGGWTAATVLNPDDTSIGYGYDIAIDAAGRVLAVLPIDNPGVGYRLDSVRWLPGQQPADPVIIGTQNGYYATLDMNDAGVAGLAYAEIAAQGRDVRFARYSPDVGWGAVADLPSDADGALVEPEVAINDANQATVLWASVSGGTDRVVEATAIAPNGSIAQPVALSSVVDAVDGLSVDLDADGRALAAWEHQQGADQDVDAALRATTGTWSPVNLNAAIPDPGSPTARIEDGTQVVTYGGNTHAVATYRTSAVLPWTTVDSGAGFLGLTGADVDPTGNAALAQVPLSGGGITGTVTGRFLDADGPAVALTGPAAISDTAVKVSWTATDTLSPVGQAFVLAREARWNAAAFTESEQVLVALASPAGFTGQPGTTYCVAVQAKDTAGNYGARSAERCTTVPLDDRSLKGKGWKRTEAADHFEGTVTTTRRSGATLVRKGVRAESLALVVTRSAKGGKVRVSLGKKQLATVSLRGSGTGEVVPVADFGKVRAGKVRVTVVSRTGRKVAIDGLVVGR